MKRKRSNRDWEGQDRAGLETRAPASSAVCEEAKQRLLSCKGDPFLRANWGPVVFFNYLIDPQLVPVPTPFSLELYEGEACVSLVAVTMRRFRPWRPFSPTCLFRPIREQRFLNLRTYVRYQDEPGALFLWGWLSRPLPLPMPSSIGGLSYSFANLDYQCSGPGLPTLFTRVNKVGSPAFGAVFRPSTDFRPCPTGSLEEFALERYSGFFVRKAGAFVFRAWHPPWVQSPVEAEVEDISLIAKQFPWFSRACLAGAHFAPGFDEVWLGRPHHNPNGIA